MSTGSLPRPPDPPIGLAWLARSKRLVDDDRLRAELDRAIDASPGSPLSFAGVRGLGATFVSHLLAPVLLSRAAGGRPLAATSVPAELRGRLARDLRDCGALLPCAGLDLPLGCSDELVRVLLALGAGVQSSPRAVAAKLGVSEAGAGAQLAVLAWWGLPDAARGHTEHAPPLAA